MKTRIQSKVTQLFAVGLVSLSASLGFSDVHEGNLSLETQLDVDGASNITEVTGNLTISTPTGTEYPIVNLDGLHNLQSVGGSLSIVYNLDLVDTLGLLNLTDVGDLAIWSNDALSDIDGLSNLALVENFMSIYNPSLERYCGLNLLFDVQGFDWDFLVVDGYDWYFSGNSSVIDLIGSPCILPVEEEDLIIDPALWIQGLLEEGILNKGQANSLLKQLAQPKNGALLKHLNALIKAGILTEELAEPIVSAVTE